MQNKSFTVIVTKKISYYNKKINVDSDKSISIRSFLIGSISHKISKINNALESDDVYSCINCLIKLGVKIKKIKNKTFLVYGRGLGSLWTKKNTSLNFGNSGTLARLLIGILSTTPNIRLKLDGDSSLKKRNMSKLINLMNHFGATFYPKNKDKFPLILTSSAIPIGVKYKAGVSAQLKSAVILAGLNSYGNTTIHEEKESRNHTENILLKNSKIININKDERKKNVINILGKGTLNPITISVPGDPSSAAFLTALTLLNKNSSIIIKNVGLNPRRTGFYQLLKKCGAKINFKNIKKNNNEVIGDIYVKSSRLKPIKASSSFYVSATDEYPIMFVIAALTSGVSSFKGISELANKESNRITEMKKILDQIGIKSKIKKNEMKIYGKRNINNFNKKILVPNLGDHRICMSTMILSLITGVKSSIKNFETVRTSSPSFLAIIKSLGGVFEIKKKT
jgi:3-phosphoshikimate 1-carboxyvinyltransferase